MATEKRYDKNYRKNEQERHGLAASLTIAAETFTASVRADPATQGSAISAFTLTSTSW